MARGVQVPPERLDIVEELWRKCVSNSTIEARLSSEWRLSRRTIRNYIAKVVARNAGMRRLSAADEAARLAEFERTKAQFEDIYLRALEGEKGADGKVRGRSLREAISAAHRRAQLLGLYPAGRVELSGPGGKPLEVDPAVAVDRLRLEIERVAQRDGGAPAPAAPAPADGGGTDTGA